MPRPSFPQSLGLFVTILFGVARGILLANWITASIEPATVARFMQPAVAPRGRREGPPRVTTQTRGSRE
jgi:hypothetical protein